MKSCGQTFWQILPLGPTGYGDSPYQSFSTFAGNPYFISLEELIRQGLLTKEECDKVDFGQNPSYVDYEKLAAGRYPLLRLAFERSKKRADAEFLKFEREQKDWLLDYALFMAVKEAHGGRSWDTWEDAIRMRREEALKEYRSRLAEEICFQEYMQYWFFTQWSAIKKYAGGKGIRIIGDIPIYVAFDSADAWTHPQLFQFDADMTPIAVAGCPPDAFTEDGQLWGNPLYCWERHQKEQYAWWVRRIRHCRELYDVIRIDHFRGFDEYYAIPYGNENARIGEWEKGPGMDLFRIIKREVPDIEIIAEDLGFLTDSVRELVKESGFPGMKVLEFAFGGDSGNDYLPHNYTQNAVVYTGTHDNETLLQFLETMPAYSHDFLTAYLNRPDRSNVQLCEDLIRLAMQSVAKYCIIPIQDYLKLGQEARMNFPSTLGGNWKWRLRKEQVTGETARLIADITGIYHRWNDGGER